MGKLLMWIGRFLFRLIGYRVIIIPKNFKLVLPAAKKLTTAFEGKGPSGEWRRHQVYALLIKVFPKVNKRTLGFAIEVSLWS